MHRSIMSVYETSSFGLTTDGSTITTRYLFQPSSEKCGVVEPHIGDLFHHAKYMTKV